MDSAIPFDAQGRLVQVVKSNRLAFGWSIKELARRTGISASTLKRFERTGTITSDKLLVLLATLRLLTPMLEALETRSHWTLEQHERFNRKAWRNA